MDFTWIGHACWLGRAKRAESPESDSNGGVTRQPDKVDPPRQSRDTTEKTPYQDGHRPARRGLAGEHVPPSVTNASAAISTSVCRSAG